MMYHQFPKIMYMKVIKKIYVQNHRFTIIFKIVFKNMIYFF